VDGVSDERRTLVHLPFVFNPTSPFRCPRLVLEALADQLLEHGDETEMCGFLVGRVERPEPTGIVIMENVSALPASTYLMDEEMLLQTAQELENTGRRVFAVFHSHTNGRHAPSMLDVEGAPPGIEHQLILTVVGGMPHVYGYTGDFSMQVKVIPTDTLGQCLRCAGAFDALHLLPMEHGQSLCTRCAS
jgi:proteasome lid subunit RPN8/RPN11